MAVVDVTRGQGAGIGCRRQGEEAVIKNYRDLGVWKLEKTGEIGKMLNGLRNALEKSADP